MIELCPHCGHHLPQSISDGITGCTHCRRVFDSSHFNRLLSTSWLVRRKQISDVETLIQRWGVKPDDAAFVIENVVDECMGQEEFFHFLKDSEYLKLKERPLDRAS